MPTHLRIPPFAPAHATLCLAAPLFSKSELAFNAALTEEIERLGFTVFLPQRNGVDATKEPEARPPLPWGEGHAPYDPRPDRGELGAWGEGVRTTVR